MALSMKVVLISVVVVLVVAGAIVGIVFAVKGSDDDDKCEGTPSIKNLAATGENGNMMLTWDVEDTTKYCSLDYNVTYFIGEEKIESIFTDDSTYTFENVEPCALITVIVVPQTAEGNSGEQIETTYQAEPGQIDSFEVSLDGEQLKFSWTVPVEYKYCKYGIKIDNAELESGLEGTEYSYHIDDTDLISCTKNTYSVYTVDQGENFGTAFEKEYTIGVITPVGNIQTIENADDTLTVSWDAPENIDSCFTDERDNSLTYTVLYINSAKEEPCTTVTETSVTCPFDADDCTGYNIKITTNAGDLKGRPHTENRIARAGPAEITDVYEDDNKLMVKWDATENLAACPDIKYELKYSDGVIEQGGQSGGDTFPFDLKSDICTTVKISVIPRIGDSYGEESSTEYYVVGGLIVTGITITENDGNLEVDWKAPANAGACTELTYVAKYTYKGDTQDEVEESPPISDESYVFELKSSPCEKLTIGVTTFNGEVSGKEISGEYSVSIPPVTGLTISEDGTRLLASWTAPADTDECELTYTATYIDKEGTLIDETDPSATPDCDFVLESSPCEKLTIAVIPHHGDVSGTEASKEHYVSIPPVTGLTISEDGTRLLASWTAPADTDECELTYTATYTDKEGTLIDETDPSATPDCDFDLASSPCEELTITVIPHHTNVDVSGTEASEEYYVSIPPVTELDISYDSGSFRASWAFPDNECTDLTYTVTYTAKDDPEVPKLDVEEEFYEFDLDLSPCEKLTISVTPVNGEDRGPEESKEYYVSIPPVTGLTITDDGTSLTASWTAPENIGVCTTPLTYTATYTKEDGQEDPQPATDAVHQDFTLNSNPCEKLTVSVIPFSGTFTGREASKVYYVMIPAVGDLEIKTVLDEPTIVATWVEPEEIAACVSFSYEVTYFEDGVKKDTGIVIDPEAPKATLDVINPCARLTVSVVPRSIQSAGTLTSSNELNQIGEVGEIGIVQTPGAQEIIATWDVPVNILYCPDLSYDVKYFENDIEVATNPFPNPPAKFNIKSECAQVKVSVLPKSPTSEGIWKDSTTIDTVADSCSGPAVLHV